MPDISFLKKDYALKMINTLIPEGKPFEIRIVKGRSAVSGYFTDPVLAVNELDRQDLTGTAVTLSLNEMDDACYSRCNRDAFRKDGVMLSDKDITGLNWIMILCDPVRPAGTGSTKGELASSREAANKTAQMLVNEGFSPCLLGSTGNAWYVLIRVNYSYTEGAVSLISDFMKAVAKLVDTDKVYVSGAFKASAGVVLSGSVAQAGAHTEERPHRFARLIYVPDYILPVKSSFLKKVTESVGSQMIHSEEYNGYSPTTFNAGEFLRKHNVSYAEERLGDGTLKYTLDICPWDINDTSRSTYVFQYGGGGIALKCVNDQYKDMKWKDLRMMLEPTKAESREIAERERIYHSYARDIQPGIDPGKDGPMFQTALQILRKKTPELTYVRTGFKAIDSKLRGLQRQGTSVWSGTRSSGKSNFLTQVCINAINDGNRVMYFNFETSDKSFMEWAYRQIAGPAYCIPTDYECYYITEPQVKLKIAQWLGDGLFVYNNIYGNDMEMILAALDRFIGENHVDLCVIDNLMAARIANLSTEQWKDGAEIHAQTAFIQRLKQLAEKHNTHIALVCHPRKMPPNGGLLKMDDISGTGNLPNATDMVFIMYRNSPSVRNALRNDRGIKDNDPLMSCDNILSVEKDKQNGTVCMIPYWYNIPSKRFLNDITENVVYPWNKGSDPVKSQTPGDCEAPAAGAPFHACGEYKESKTADDTASAGKGIYQITPGQARLSRALDNFRAKHGNGEEVTVLWRNAMKGKCADSMTDEDWAYLEAL